MRGDPREFEVHSPRTLPEALTLLAQGSSGGSPLLPMAGGTDLMVLLEMGVLQSKRLLNLQALPELRGMTLEQEHLRIGAGTTFSQIRSHAAIQENFPMLREAASQVGALAIQNRGTIGGNIANASPAADSSPVLLAYDAEVELASASGTRKVPYAAFHHGYKRTELQSGELISAVLLPVKWKGTHQHYRKVGARAAQAISKVAFAGLLKLDDNARISECRVAMGSVGPTPLRCRTVEAALAGQMLDFKLITRAKEALMREITPIDDIRSNRDYRMRVALNLLEDFLLSARK